MKNKNLFKGLKVFFILLLALTAVGKLLDNRGFAEVIISYQFGLPGWLALGLCLAVSLFELFLAIALILGIYQRYCGILLILMHAGYTLLSIISIQRGLQLTNCGCFGVFWQRPLGWGTVVEDLVLMGLSILFYTLVPFFGSFKFKPRS